MKEAGIVTQTIDVTSASVTVAGNLVTINPSDFGYSTAVNIEIAAGAFKDLANNNYAGIADATTWNFNTEACPIRPSNIYCFRSIHGNTLIMEPTRELPGELHLLMMRHGQAAMDN